MILKYQRHQDSAIKGGLAGKVLLLQESTYCSTQLLPCCGQHASDSVRWACSKCRSDSDGDAASSVAATALHLINTPQQMPASPPAAWSRSSSQLGENLQVSSHRARATGDAQYHPALITSLGIKITRSGSRSPTEIPSIHKIGALRRKLVEW